MGNATHNVKVQKAMESLAAGADVAIGIEPPDGDFNRLVLAYTMRRPLLVQSVFTQPGGRRHDPLAHAELSRHIDTEAREVTQDLTSPWYGRFCTHHCWGTLPGNRCCVTAA